MKFAQEMTALANAHEEQGEYGVAEQLYRRALKHQIKSVGKDSPELAPYIYDLAMICAALDHDDEARELFAWLLAVAPREAELTAEIKLVLSELSDTVNAA